MFKTRLWLWLFFGCLCFQRLSGHQIDAIEFDFHSVDGEWRLNGMMDLGYMMPGTRGDPDAQPPGKSVLMYASPDELADLQQQTERTLRKIVALKFDGKEIPWRIVFPPVALDFSQEEAEDWAIIPVVLVAEARRETGDFAIHWQDDLGAELIVNVGGTAHGTILSAPPGDDLVLLHVSAAGKSSSQNPTEGFVGWLRSGFRHVIPLGLDHMLFILGLFLLLPKWKPLLGQSLMFTTAHSITLSLAVMGWVAVPAKPVEVLIAASIMWIGIENLLLRKPGKQRFVLVFLFGLLHGLGFASVLSEKLGNATGDRLVVPLIGFNLGVEIAQISLLGLAFLLLIPLKKWTPRIQFAGSLIIALAGLFWVVERLV